MWRRDEQRAAHALDRYRQGVRVSAIAADLKISPSTVRRWITRQLKQIADDERAARVEQLQAAIESQRAILCEAWVAYHREQTREDQRRTEAAEDAVARRTRANHAATYLRLALTAQREVARLQGLYSYQQLPDDHLTITIIERPADPEDRPPDGYLPDATPDAMPYPTSDATPDAAPDPAPDTQTTQLVQIAQLSPTPTLASPASPASPTSPTSPNQPLTHRHRQRLRYLQTLQHQPAHQWWPLAYSGP